MPLGERSHERLFARKILVQRSDADPRRFRDPVGARFIETFFLQNASSRGEDRFDRLLSTRLVRQFSGGDRAFLGHPQAPIGMRVEKYERVLILLRNEDARKYSGRLG